MLYCSGSVSSPPVSKRCKAETLDLRSPEPCNELLSSPEEGLIRAFLLLLALLQIHSNVLCATSKATERPAGKPKPSFQAVGSLARTDTRTGNAQLILFLVRKEPNRTKLCDLRNMPLAVMLLTVMSKIIAE